jgi:hypothetical protein
MKDVKKRIFVVIVFATLLMLPMLSFSNAEARKTKWGYKYPVIKIEGKIGCLRNEGLFEDAELGILPFNWRGSIRELTATNLLTGKPITVPNDVTPPWAWYLEAFYIIWKYEPYELPDEPGDFTYYQVEGIAFLCYLKQPPG